MLFLNSIKVCLMILIYNNLLFFFVFVLLYRIRNLLLFVKFEVIALRMFYVFFVFFLLFFFVFFFVCSSLREGFHWGGFGVCTLYIQHGSHKSVEFSKLCILMIYPG